MPEAPGHFSAEQQRFFDAACERVTIGELRRLVTEMTAIPSPTGDEEALAEYLVRELNAGGLDASYQLVEDTQGNAVARLAGDGSGPSVMLYAPIDMHIMGDAADDGPWIDFAGRKDLVVTPTVDDDFVFGLGAENPKGHAACVLAAAAAIARAGVPLRGELQAGFGAGGMPVNRSPDPHIARPDVGHGVGCAFMLTHGYEPDFAVIAKPGFSVAYEEVGLCWFEIAVRGDYNYAGIGLRPGVRNPLVDAAKVIGFLEEWFPEYTARNTSGLVAPKASVSAIVAGWPEKPAFIPDVCKIYIDLRISPRTDPDDAQRQLEAALDTLRAKEPGIVIGVTRTAAIPGTSTAADSWIVRSSISAWERVFAKPHALQTGTSGATDANILRGLGVPTARIGMPPLANTPFSGRFSMGVVSLQAMLALTHALIAIAIDTCTRERSEVGLLTV